MLVFIRGLAYGYSDLKSMSLKQFVLEFLAPTSVNGNNGHILRLMTTCLQLGFIAQCFLLIAFEVHLTYVITWRLIIYHFLQRTLSEHMPSFGSDNRGQPKSTNSNNGPPREGDGYFLKILNFQGEEPHLRYFLIFATKTA